MSDQYDKLICGNCGYDGGRSHMTEKLKWQEQLSQAMQVSDDTKQTRAIAASICVMFCFLVGAIAWGNSVPDPVPTADMAWSKAVAESYEQCMRSVASIERARQTQALQDCNDTFRDHLSKPQKQE